ncbi:MAG: tyrosine-type recombinase/integrase [Armatimonadota bacterium]|nr:tyrosine-type recombinase/integrase [Armatimonadota bacterium]
MTPNTQTRDRQVRSAPFELTQFAGQFLAHLRDYRKCAESTIIAYRRDLDRFADFLRTHRLPTDVGQIKPQHVQAFAASLTNYAASTITRNLDVISSFFAHLQRTGIVDLNPVGDVERPKRPRKLPRAATADQVRALVAAAKTPRGRAMILLLACTGMRRGELLGLDIGDLAADLSEVKVQGKGERERVLPVPEQCREALRSYLDVREAEEPALFVNRAGRRIGTTTFHRWFRRLLRGAGLEDSDLTPHSLRHSYATELLRAGADVETIRDLMGHSDVSVTGVYLATDPSRKRAAVESLPDFGGEVAHDGA